MGSLEKAPANKLGKYRSRAVTADKEVAYVDVDKVGFDRVPKEVVDILKLRKHLVGKMITASADSPLTKRRADGSHYQFMTAWWVSAKCCTVIDITRELAPKSTSRFKPVGPWSVTGTTHLLPKNLKPVRSIWSRSQSHTTATGITAGKKELTDEPLDLLPLDVARPLIGGLSNAWRIFTEVFAEEVVVAMKIASNRVIAIKATRVAGSEEKLVHADWAIDTLDAPIASSYPVSIRKATNTLSQGFKVPWKIR